jgi:hypothetical protein
MKILAGFALCATCLVFMGSYSYFSWYVAPFALRHWAEVNGYHVTKQKKRRHV